MLLHGSEQVVHSCRFLSLASIFRANDFSGILAFSAFAVTFFQSVFGLLSSLRYRYGTFMRVSIRSVLSKTLGGRKCKSTADDDGEKDKILFHKAIKFLRFE